MNDAVFHCYTRITHFERHHEDYIISALYSFFGNKCVVDVEMETQGTSELRKECQGNESNTVVDGKDIPLK
jgi:hypothetical protein